MTGGIFLIKDDKLVKMEESAYDSEELLQKLLEDYPDLLAGDQINQDEPKILKKNNDRRNGTCILV